MRRSTALPPRLARDLSHPDWLQDLRQARIKWLQSQPPDPAARIGRWRVCILEATDYPRLKTSAVPIGYVPSAEGMRLGHGFVLAFGAGGRGQLDFALGGSLSKLVWNEHKQKSESP